VSNKQGCLLSKLRLLLRPINGDEIVDTVLGVELNTDLPIQACFAPIETSCFDASHVRHNFELRIQAGATSRAKEVFVDLPACAGCVPGFWSACTDVSSNSHHLHDWLIPEVTLKDVRGTTAFDVYAASSKPRCTGRSCPRTASGPVGLSVSVARQYRIDHAPGHTTSDSLCNDRGQ
jgi:hypothetical protein